MKNQKRFGSILVILLLILCYLEECMGTIEETDGEQPISNPLENGLEFFNDSIVPDIDRVFFQQIDPTLHEAFFGLLVNFLVNLAINLVYLITSN